ncbi:MAG: ABC transporter substrate-binding protein [bacterium]|nr:ABC transporter substrate-binding protein [bacterium]
MYKMKNVFKIGLIPFLLSCMLSCSPPKEEKIVLRTLGGWDMPPMYNGNPFAPGGVGAARDFIYGMLFGYDIFKGEFWPWLGLEFKETPKMLTVKLREGILWEDGTPFTSKDVYTTFVIHGGLGEWSEVWRYMDRIETPDSYTVIFRYGSARSILAKFYILTNLIDASVHIYGKWLDEAEQLLKLHKDMWQREVLDEDIRKSNTELVDRTRQFREGLHKFKPEKPVGYGPFKVKIVVSSEMVLEKSKTFWTTEFDEIRIGRFTTNELVWASFIAGEVDIEKPATPIDVVKAIIRAQPKIKHIPVSDFTAFCLLMNNERFPFSEKDFRKALAYIIDRDKVRMVALYYGTKVEYPCGLLPSILDIWTTPEFRQILNPYEMNHAKATELLKGIGLIKARDGCWTTSDGKKLKFEIATNPSTDWVLAAEEISRQLTSFGLKTNVRIIEGTLYGPILGAGEYDMAIEFGISAKLHPVQGYRNLYKSKEWIARVTRFVPRVTGQNGEELNLEELQKELFMTFEPVRQREIIGKLAWATNEYLPVLDLLEKNAQFFICDGVRVTGWPYGEELQNKLAFNFRIAILKWMVDRTLKPGPVRIR